MTGKKKKSLFKTWVGRVHLWLGLTSGLMVLFLSVTGCLYVFSHEITNWLRHDEMYVQQVKENPLPVSEVWKSAQDFIGADKPISNVTVYNNPEKALVFTVYERSEGSVWYFKNIKNYYSIYADPYTGKVLGIYDEELDFFNIVKMLHWSLLLETEIGQPVIGWSTFIFVVMLITGIILWWPKNKAARKQRFTFLWKDSTKWRRKNYDLHNILGFYISAIALIIAFTGMVFAFTWFKAIVYVAASGTIVPPEVVKEQSVVADGDKDAAFNKACSITKERHAGADAFRLTPAADSTGVINAYVQQHEGVYYKLHNIQFDQYNGKLLSERRHEDKNFGEKLITANYDIHVGAILGIPGKIIAFIGSFICGMLPVTGFLIWYGRNFKKSPAEKKKSLLAFLKLKKAVT
jgi:uncharacterized iron-regulated membrane protein